MNIGILLNGLLPVFGIMLLGFFLKSRILKEDIHWIPIEKITFLVLIPSFIISTLGSADMSAIEIWPIVSTLLLALGTTFLLLIVLYRALTRGQKQKIAAYTSLFQTSTRFNGFIALALVASLYGETAIAIVALGLITLMPVINIVNITMLTWLLTDEKVSFSSILWKILTNPIIAGCLIGIGINLIGLPLWQPLSDMLSLLGKASLSITLLSVGAGLRLSNFQATRIKLLLSCFLKLLLMPVLVIAIGLFLGLQGLEFMTVIILAAMPTAANGYILAREMGGDAPLYANASSLQVVLSVVTIPVWMEIAAQLSGGF
ncbi:MAG: AEC family transporter [Sneathiella sp.]